MAGDKILSSQISRNEVIGLVFRLTLFGALTYFGVKWMVKALDPTRKQKIESQKRVNMHLNILCNGLLKNIIFIIQFVLAFHFRGNSNIKSMIIINYSCKGNFRGVVSGGLNCMSLNWLHENYTTVYLYLSKLCACVRTMPSFNHTSELFCCKCQNLVLEIAFSSFLIFKYITLSTIIQLKYQGNHVSVSFCSSDRYNETVMCIQGAIQIDGTLKCSVIFLGDFAHSVAITLPSVVIACSQLVNVLSNFLGNSPAFVYF